MVYPIQRWMEPLPNGTVVLDVSSAYPCAEQLFNVGKEQTLREVCEVHGVSEAIKRRASYNLTMPRQNAYEVCQDILGAPSLPVLLAQYQQDKASGGT